MTNKKRVWSVVLKMPLVLLVLAGLIGSFYAAVKNIQDISWGAPIVFLIFVLSYILGMWLRKDN